MSVLLRNHGVDCSGLTWSRDVGPLVIGVDHLERVVFGCFRSRCLRRRRRRRGRLLSNDRQKARPLARQTIRQTHSHALPIHTALKRRRRTREPDPPLRGMEIPHAVLELLQDLPGGELVQSQSGIGEDLDGDLELELDTAGRRCAEPDVRGRVGSIIR